MNVPETSFSIKQKSFTAKGQTTNVGNTIRGRDNFNGEEITPYIDPEVKPLLRLWASVLIMAIQDYSKYRVSQEFGSDKRKDHQGVEKKRGLNALSWIFTDQSDAPKSFKWTCAMLGHDPERIRNKVKTDWQNLAKIRMEEPRSYSTAANDSELDEDYMDIKPPRSKYANKRKENQDENNQSVDVVENGRVRSGGSKKWAFPDFSAVQASK
jgi:hypothetical protein